MTCASCGSRPVVRSFVSVTLPMVIIGSRRTVYPEVPFNGRDSVQIGVVMAPGFQGDGCRQGDRANLRTVHRINAGWVSVDQISIAEVVHEAIGEFSRRSLEALVIVLVVSLVDRLAIGHGHRISPYRWCSPPPWPSCPVRDRVAGISLGALIIALGLLVDDAMIVVELMERKLDEGLEKT